MDGSDDVETLIDNLNIIPVSPIPNEYLCVYCQEIVRNAQQAPCGCMFCKPCVEQFLETNCKFCPGNEEDCKIRELTEATLFHPDINMNRKVLKIKVRCPNSSCSYECELKRLRDHIRICKEDFVKCPYSIVGCTIPDLDRSRIVDHLHQANIDHAELMTASTSNMINDITYLKKQLAAYKSEVELLKESLDMRTNEIENQRVEQETCKEIIKKLIDDLKNETMKSNEWKKSCEDILKNHEFIFKQLSRQNEFIWRVGDIHARHKMALRGKNGIIFSDPFHSHHNGYLIRLMVNLNGVDDFRGQFLYVGFQILRGSFDQILDWPFKHEICISILNQDSKTDHIIYKFKFDENENVTNVFTKPRDIENDIHGEDKFINFRELFSSTTLRKQDSIFIKCSVNLL